MQFGFKAGKSTTVLHKNDLNCEPLSYGEDSVTRQKTLVNNEQELEIERSCTRRMIWGISVRRASSIYLIH